jgi:DNA-binding transcriptional ArsR family regulator
MRSFLTTGVMASPSQPQLRERLLMVFDDIVSLLGAMGTPSRLRILIALLGSSQSYQNLKMLTELKKSALSSHLVLLREHGLIQKQSHGNYELTETGQQYMWLLGQFFEAPKSKE